MKPLCKICGKETKRNDSVTCSRECHGKRLSALYAGRSLTEEWKTNQNSAKIRDRIIKFGDYQCHRCEKRFETNLSLRAHSSHCQTNASEVNVTCEICGSSFKTERGLKVHVFSHDNSWSGSRKEKLRTAAQSRVSQKTSRSEIRFFEMLKEFFGESNVIHKFKITGCSHEYDFYIPSKNMIVEFDGDYWHGNKSLYSLTPRMKRQYRLDRAWDEKATEAGYSIKRIWESESKELRMETL